MGRSMRFLPALLLAGVLSVGVVACGRSEGKAGNASFPGTTTVGGNMTGRVATGTTVGAKEYGFASGAQADQKVEVSPDPGGNLRWEKPEYTAKAGDVTFVVRNASPTRHDFGVEGNGVNAHSGDIDPASAASGSKNVGTNNYTLKDLKPGEYQIVCAIHRNAGMVAKLIVK